MDLHNTSAEIGAARPTIAVFGIGAIEQHSYHLPVATDWYETRAVCEQVARELDALLLPVLPFSMSQCHGPAAGTVWLKPETLAAVVRDVVRSLRAQGIRKVVLVNGHGGNFVLQSVVRELNYTYPDMMVVMPPEIGSGIADLIEHSDVDSHAGEIETSMMLAITPHLVKADRIDCVPAAGRGFFDYAFMPRWAPDGVTGVATAADAVKGQRIIDTTVANIVRAAREAFAYLESLRKGS